MLARLNSIVITPLLLCLAGYTHAQIPNCLDSQAALAFWRPIAETADSIDANTLAIPLLQCLNSPDPALRDEIGYGLFSHWLRSEMLAQGTQLQLLQLLSDNLQERGTELSLQRSFSALILSELLRADAMQAFMSDAQREQLLEVSVEALQIENDYRGWEPELGWVHPVAHLADVMWRFSLHPSLDEPQARRILAGIRSKVGLNSIHYGFNEGDRLARPLAILLRREALPPEEFVDWLSSFDTPHSVNTWPETFTSAQGLAELHNSKQFIRALSDQLAGVELAGPIQEKLTSLVELFTGLV